MKPQTALNAIGVISILLIFIGFVIFSVKNENSMLEKAYNLGVDLSQLNTSADWTDNLQTTTLTLDQIKQQLGDDPQRMRESASRIKSEVEKILSTSRIGSNILTVGGSLLMLVIVIQLGLLYSYRK